jgi:hypothetical protein
MGVRGDSGLTAALFKFQIKIAPIFIWNSNCAGPWRRQNRRFCKEQAGFARLRLSK